ncbi:hypothetical protein DEU56DRAFT_976162 [Suillus clintonianus]|uniref:uncharacterized protein n=1 Tax=Suillus clintonianus TaxID=1904413 RepID=UPI001B876801|nr:uncharacterized protein DEU56DRAFT_976162 [Suillus clintonianus]KAG2155583.1 hypothetical protein DEU56DRAFT_976162 [Suillus clintonianus]
MSLSHAVARLGYPACSFTRSVSRPPILCRAAPAFRVKGDQRRFLITNHDPSLSYVADVGVIVDKIRRYIPTANVGALHQQFYGLFRVLNDEGKDKPTVPPLTQEEIHDALSVLAMSGRPHDLDMVVKILVDLPMLCGVEVGVRVYNVILRGLIKNGNPQTIFNWLMDMPQKPRNITPTLLQWHMFFEWCAESGLVKFLHHSISKMHRSGRRPTIKTFEILFNALFDTGAPIKKIYDALDIMEHTSLTYDENFAKFLYDGFVKLGLADRAQEIKDVYWKRFRARSRTTDPKMIEWTESIEREAENSGIAAAVTLCKSLQRDGFRPNPHTLTLLVRHTHRLDHLRYAETGLRLKASVVQWAILISNAVRIGDLTGALSIYEESKATGITPGTPLVHPLVNALCTTSSTLDDAAIDRALELYKDLAEAAPITQSKQEPQPPGRRHSSGPDANLYNILFRAFGASKNVEKYYPIALSLLEDMEARNVEFDSPMAVSALAIVAMRCTSSFDGALKAYKQICKRPNAPRLDAKGYQAILHTLTQLSFGGQETLPSVWHYFEVVKDMQMAGVEITAPVYTILLRHLALLSAELPPEERDALAAAVRRAHDHLTLDPSFTPDTVLWNQLMDSYQRVGLFAEAYRVWEMLFITGRFNQASVAIIIDACGFASAWPMAAQVCLKLSKLGFKFNLRTWNAWIECMCRVGKLDDALKVACLEMGKDQPNVAPDVNTVKVLLSFAARTNQQDEVMDRIKRYLPQLWHTLPKELDGYFIREHTTVDSK